MKATACCAVTAALAFCAACNTSAKQGDATEDLKNDYRSAISAYNDGNAPRYKSYFCKAFVDVASKMTPLDDSEKLRATLELMGKRVITDIGAVKIDGDHATADVSYYDEKLNKDKPSKETFNFMHEGSNWKLCVATVNLPVTSIPPFPQ